MELFSQMPVPGAITFAAEQLAERLRRRDDVALRIGDDKVRRVLLLVPSLLGQTSRV